MKSNEIKALIIDDELDARLVLSTYLSEYLPEVQLLGTFQNALEGLEAIKILKPNLVFLDIQMPIMDAFNMLTKIEETINVEIIFTTAHKDYALKAIKYNALDYLLKPIDRTELIDAVQKLKTKLKLKSNKDASAFSIKKIIIPERDGYSFIDIEQIVRCEANGNYTSFYLNNDKTVVSSKTLKETEKQLSGDPFIRIHKSHIINKNYVKKYIKGDGGIIIMNDGSEVEVSRRNKDIVLESFGI